MVLIGMLNFISAANTTSSIILLSSRETVTLSLLALEWGSADVSQVEAAGIVTLVIMALTIGVALVMRQFALRVGLRQDMRARDVPGRPIAAAERA
jgi:ABC-type Fe3+ transport system permease subunit